MSNSRHVSTDRNSSRSMLNYDLLTNNVNSESEVEDEREIIIEDDLDKHYAYLRDPSGSGYKTYTQRWYILSTIAIVNFTNALIWIVFAPVTDLTSRYFSISFDQVNWLSLVYLVASIPCGFLASWLLDTFGLRGSIICAAWLNLIGSAIRNLTVFDFISHGSEFAVLLTGQTIAACGQTFIMFTPAKVAALWFADNQRTLATTIAALANSLGVMAANILAPGVVKEPDDIPIVLYVCTGVSVIGMIMSTCGICSSLPPSPPSPSAAAQSEPFFVGIQKLKGNLGFWILTFSVGGGVALFTTFTTYLEQILCPQNYSNDFAGLCGALMIAFGTVGAVIAGIICDKTRMFEEVTKIGFCLSVLSCIAFVQLARMRDQEVAVAASIILFGFFGFGIYPPALEMAVEATFPVAEATSTGLIFLSGQIQGVVIMLLMQYTAQPLTAHEKALPQACPNDGEFEPLNWTIPDLISNGFAVVYALALVCFFKADYRRMWAERRVKTESLPSNNQPVGEDT